MSILEVGLKVDCSTIGAVTLDFYDTLVYHRMGVGRGAALMQYLDEQGLKSDCWEHQVLYDVFEKHGVEYRPDLPGDEKGKYLRRSRVTFFL